MDIVQNVNGKSEEAAPQEALVVVSKENVAIPVQNVNGKPGEADPQETQVVVSKENVATPMQNVSGKPEEAAPQEAKVVAGKENVAIPMQNVNGKPQEAAFQEPQVAAGKENVAIPMQNANGKPHEAAPQEPQVAAGKENVAIPMQNVNGKPQEAAPQEPQVAAGKENVAIPMQNVNGKPQEAAGKENVAIPMQNANGKPQEAAPQEVQVVVSKENVAIPMQNVNGKSDEAALQEVQVAVSKENVAILMQNVNGKSEQAALQEIQVAVGKENVALPITASSESEQKGVLQPCKGIEQAPLSNGNVEDVQVNIIGVGGINSGKGMEDASEDRTDTECSSSSSFGDTGSCMETDSSSGLSDAEVESPMCDNWSEPLLIRKKKVTSHWRRFIRPLMWRCKWLELQLRKLHSQKLKYDKEIAAYDYKKQLDFSKYAVDGFDVKSIPISDGIHRNEVMKRKKRKRAEECDLSSYVANHTIFSYYENRDGTDDACVQDFRGVAIRGNPCNIEESTLNDMWYSVDHEDTDISLDAIFQKIEALELQVQKLKARIDNVVSENPGKFCSVTQLSRSGPSNGFNNSGRNPASFAGNENTFPDSFAHASFQLKSEFFEEDVLMPGNTSTYEGITPFIETTNRPRVEVLQENIKDDVLIQSQAAKEELHDFERTINQPVEITKEPDGDQKSISLAELSEPYLVHNGHSALKVYSSTSKSNSSRNKKRRQKSGSKRSGKRR